MKALTKVVAPPNYFSMTQAWRDAGRITRLRPQNFFRRAAFRDLERKTLVIPSPNSRETYAPLNVYNIYEMWVGKQLCFTKPAQKFLRYMASTHRDKVEPRR